VQTPGQPAFFMALELGRCHVSVTANFSQRRPRDRQRVTFSASGYDDRHDMVWWLADRTPRRIGSWIEAEVVDEPEPALPSRGPRRRKKVDWNAFFDRMRARDLRRIAKLEARLRRVASGTPYQPPLWRMADPACAFRALLNGRKVADASVNRPGTLSVTIFAQRRRGRQSASLQIHGGDHIGPVTQRWYRWPANDMPLRIGDRVRILVVRPRAKVSRTVQSVNTLEPETVEDISEELKSLRANMASDIYASNARMMRRFERQRPPPREYELAPRSRIRRGGHASSA